MRVAVGASGYSHSAKYCHNGGKPFASSLTAASSGSKMGIMAPSGGPLKLPVCRGKATGSAVQALWGQQWTRLASSSQRSTATTGAWPSPAHHGVGLARGPRWRSCPFRRSPETAGVQGKSRESAGSVPLWGHQWTRLPDRASPEHPRQGRTAPKSSPERRTATRGRPDSIGRRKARGRNQARTSHDRQRPRDCYLGMQPEVATGETSTFPSTISALTDDAPHMHGA